MPSIEILDNSGGNMIFIVPVLKTQDLKMFFYLMENNFNAIKNSNLS